MQNIKVDKVDKKALTVEKVHAIIVLVVDKVHFVGVANAKSNPFSHCFLSSQIKNNILCELLQQKFLERSNFMNEKWTGNLIGKMHNEGVTYQDLADEMAVTKSYISMILNGSRKPKDIKQRMEDAFASIVEKRKTEQSQ